ncbi:MAG: sulfatase-like hydrolase/transferase [Cyanobacteria bacterium J06631_2]
MTRPNILMIMVDQMRYPCFGYGKDGGFVDSLKRILGFQDSIGDCNEFRKYFPGFSALADNAVVFNNHKAASSACVPSRTALFTGQYGTRTGVLQTDGIFKDGLDKNFPWLDPTKFPTLGHWMRGNGYKTHYFGKWHMAGEDTSNLEAYGFSDWELSYPDPHGSLPNNLGYYRDYQFEDITVSFLRRQGLGIPYDVAYAKYNVAETDAEVNGEEVNQSLPEEPTPWFAVSSFTNPHDIGSYPGLPSAVSDARLCGQPFALAVPPKGAEGKVPQQGTMKIKLNKLGFPQNNANVSPTWDEDLLNNNKPDCQFEYSYKVGLALASKTGVGAVEQAVEDGTEMSPDDQMKKAVEVTLDSDNRGFPFALTSDPELASRAFIQYYGYLMSEVDQHISAVLNALDESGQADNTIVIFCADHGEYAASHYMMMEKWHSAYEELLHVPMVVRFPMSLHQVPGGLKQITDIVTSHVDILPTVLGLTGIAGEEMKDIKDKLGYTNAPYPVGNDLTPLIYGKSSAIFDDSQQEREGVLFITHDTITEPLKLDTGNSSTEEEDSLTAYQVFQEAVETLRNSKDEKYPDEVSSLASNSVSQPSLINCVMTNDNWKLVRYFEPTDDPNDYSNNNQFELYDLNTDPTEKCNLVVYNKKHFPTVIEIENDSDLDLDPDEIREKAKYMKDLLEKLEEKMLSWPEATTKPAQPTPPSRKG